MLILKNRFRTRAKFLEAYNEDLPGGGLFCPTTRALEKDDQVVAEIYFPGLPNKILIRGRVVWWRSSLPRLRVRAGAMVEFLEDDQDKRDFVLKTAAGEGDSTIKRRHPRIPVALDVRWKPVDDPNFREAKLHEISIGGALLVADEQLQKGDDIVLELLTPGGAHPIPIAGKITHAASAGAGVRFIYRDGGGSQRLREIVRRLLRNG